MNNSEVSQDVKELNLMFLLLAQRLVKQDRVDAMLNLGVSQELAELLSTATLQEIMRYASSNLCVCTCRLDAVPFARQIMTEESNTPQARAHLSIVMASRAAQAVAA